MKRLLIFIFLLNYGFETKAQEPMPYKVLEDFYTNLYNSDPHHFWCYKLFDAQTTINENKGITDAELEKSFLEIYTDKSVQEKVFKNVYNYFGKRGISRMKMELSSFKIPLKSVDYLATYIYKYYAPATKDDNSIIVEPNDSEKEEEIIIPSINIMNEEETIYTLAEVMPRFPGGEEAFKKYIAKNLKYPPLEKESGVSGTVYMSFIINKDGSVKNAKVERGVPNGDGLNTEALRIIESMPKWESGQQNGRPVQVLLKYPVKFSMR